MKTIAHILTLVAAPLLLAVPAFAVDTAKVYNSGPLVLCFLAFLALVVLVQVFPVVLMLYGMAKGLLKGSKESQTDQARVAAK